MTDAALATLRTLSAELPLAPHWGPIEPFVESLEIDGLLVHSVGLYASSERGVDATGSAAALIAAPVERAYFELLERTAILDAQSGGGRELPLIDDRGTLLGSVGRDMTFPEAPRPDEWRYSLSNGIAAARTIEHAMHAARAELAERDSVLRSWFGGRAPTRHRSPAFASWCPTTSYDVEMYSFANDGPSSDLVVAGVFAFPRRAQAPLVYGLGAARTLDEAIERAGSECQQRLAFLWGEAVPSEVPPFAPTASYHQELYLWPASHVRLRAWLRGEHADGAFLVAAPGPTSSRFVDLTPEHLISRAWVVKALPRSEIQLTFGRGHPDVPPALQRYGVHPIA